VANELGVPFREYATPQEFRYVQDFDAFMDMLIQEPSFVIYIDECHEIDPKMVSHAKFSAYLRKCLDRQNDGKVIQVGDRTTTYDRTKKVFILATNYEDKVEKALKSRTDVINLKNYTMDEMRDITRMILEKNGMEADCDQTLMRIASCGRGTARPIVNLVQNVFKIMGIATVDNDIAMEALQMKEMYPAGLKSDEVRLLELVKDHPYNRMQILAAITGLQGTLAESVAYLIHKGLLECEHAKYQITEKGKKYLNYVTREGFTW